MGARGTREGAGLEFLASLGSNAAECIEYPFGRFSTGYGKVRSGGRPRPAHAVSYELHVGEIPAGSEICHNCGNRACVNPLHLRADSHVSNMADKLAHGTHHRGSRNGRAKLNEALVAHIRREVHRGTPQKSLAASLGVSPQTVNHIIRGRTWAHLAD